MIRLRILIGAAGAALIGLGGLYLVQDLRWAQLVGLVVWLAAAVVLHDAILVPVVTVLDVVLRRSARRLPPVVVTIVEAGFAVGALMTALVMPELVAQARGTRNPTVVPGDYGLRLIALWGVIVLVVAVLSAFSVRRARRSGRRSG